MSGALRYIIMIHMLMTPIYQKILKPKISKLESYDNLDVICIMVPHDHFINLEISEYKKYCKFQPNPIFFDLKSKFSRKDLMKNGFKVLRT